jgi:multiple sugar transport system substrate-binding protein
MKKWCCTIAGIVTAASLLTACGGGDDAAGGNKKDAEANDSKGPVTLKVLDTLFTDQEFAELIEAPLKKTYPNIAMERTKNTKDPLTTVNEMLAGNVLPDVLLMPIYFEQDLRSKDITEPLSAHSKQDGANYTKIDPAIMETLKASGSGDFYALPMYKNVVLTFYNKDIFDKFGVPYPKDGMTYSEYVDLSRKLTTMQDNVQYVGMQMHHSLLRGQISALALDPKTGKSMLVQNEGFKRVFELEKNAYSIQGMELMNINKQREAFFKERRLAMMMDWAANFTSQAKTTTDLNWDMVTMPVWEDKLDVHSQSDFHAGYVSKVGKNKSAAFKVINFISTSPEIQMNLSKAGRISVLTDTAISKEYGSNFFKDKNVAAIEKTKMNPVRERHPLENRNALVGNFIDSALTAVVQGSKDINTALREASETIDKNVEAELKK